MQKNSVFTIGSLRPNSHYNFYVYDCETDSQIEAFNIRTSHDGKYRFESFDGEILMSIFSLAVPGAVIEPLHVRNDGIALTWRPPLTDDSTVIFYYRIDWTISNKTFTANVTGDKHYFEVKPMILRSFNTYSPCILL